MIAVVKMRHCLPVALTRIKAKLAKFKHFDITQDSQEWRVLKENVQVEMAVSHKMITGSTQN
jgi:hypothetical protein